MSDCDCNCDCGSCDCGDCSCFDCDFSCPDCSCCQGSDACCVLHHAPCCRLWQCCCDSDSQYHSRHCHLSGCCGCCNSRGDTYHHSSSSMSWWWWCYWCDDEPLYMSNNNLSPSTSASGKYTDAQRRQAIELMVTRDLNTLRSSTLPSFQWSKRDYEGMRLGDVGLRFLFNRLSMGGASSEQAQGSTLYSPSSYSPAPPSTSPMGSYHFVTRLELQDHDLTDGSTATVLAPLLQVHFPGVTSLNLSRNYISVGGASSVAHILRWEASAIKVVSIIGNPLSSLGFAEVVRAATVCAPLERLEIGDFDMTADVPNYVGEDGLPSNAAVDALIGLIRCSASIKSLRLVGPFVWMGSMHFNNIVAAVRTSCSLTELDLHECLSKEICEGPGVQAMMLASLDVALCSNTCPLKKLTVRCALGDDAVERICRAVANAVALESLCLCRCGLSHRALCMFGEAIALNHSLRSIDLSYPGVTAAGALTPIATALARRNRMLREVNVVGAEITTEDICELQYGIEVLENTSLCSVRHNPCEGDERLHRLLEANAALRAAERPPAAGDGPFVQRETVMAAQGDDDDTVVDTSAVVAEVEGEHLPPCSDCPFQPDRV